MIRLCHKYLKNYGTKHDSWWFDQISTIYIAFCDKYNVYYGIVDTYFDILPILHTYELHNWEYHHVCVIYLYV